MRSILVGVAGCMFSAGASFCQDFSVYTVATSEGDITAPSLAEVLGNPAIAYLDSETGNLMYVRAKGEGGTAWRVPTIANWNVGEGTCRPELDVVANVPAIVHCVAATGDLVYASSGSMDGYSGFGTRVIYSDGRVMLASMEVVAGNPAVAFYDQTNDSTKFIRANDVWGGIWGNPVTVTEGGSGGVSLAVVDGIPAIAVAGAWGQGISIYFGDNPTGTSWASPPSIVVQGNPYSGFVNPSFRLINGKPALTYSAWYEPGIPFVNYVQASDASGTNWNDPVGLDYGRTDAVSLALIDGRPATAYLKFSPNFELRYVTSQDSDGSSWNDPVVVQGLGPGMSWPDPDLANIAGQPGIAFVTGQLGSILMYASRVFPGTTVITHGFAFEAAGGPAEWQFSMARKIKDRVGGGAIRVYDKEEGTFEPCDSRQGKSVLFSDFCDEDSPGETIIVFDWASESQQDAIGYSEAAAEALMASLMISESQGNIDLENLHLIGHSRGTVVNSEVAERLLKLDRPVGQVTALDPHDWGFWGGDHDYDVNELHPEYPRHPDKPLNFSGVNRWQGIGYWDTYWEDSATVHGRRIPGSSNLYLNFPEVFGNHSLVHSFYHFSIPEIEPGTAGESTDDGDGGTYNDEWYGSWIWCWGRVDSEGNRQEVLWRGSEGYNQSRYGTIFDGRRCVESTEPTTVVRFDFNLPEGLVNGNFEKGTNAGWVANGGVFEAGIRSVNPLKPEKGKCAVLNDKARHNRFYMPPDTAAVRFCRFINHPGRIGDWFRVALLFPNEGLKRILHERELFEWLEDSDADSPWPCFSLPIDPEGVEGKEAGNVWMLQFEISPNDGDAEVWIDDVSLIVYSDPSVSSLFSDDFETGDLTKWSTSVGD